MVVWRLLQGLDVDVDTHDFFLRHITQKEALSWAWELLTEVYKLPADQLYVSYFEGDPKQGLEPDEETKQIWLDLGIPENRIVKGNAKDNFWGRSSCLYFTNDTDPEQKWVPLARVDRAGQFITSAFT